MTTQIKTLLRGGILAIVILGLGWANTARLTSKLHHIESDGWRVISVTKIPPTASSSSSKKMSDKVVPQSDLPPTLAGTPDPESLELQRKYALKKARARIAISDSRLYTYVLAGGVLTISTIPWLWYFLLRRIRELREAITGK